MTAGQAAARPPLVFAPRIRFLRILWRLLPWVGLSVLLVAVPWLLGAAGEGLHQLLLVGLGLVAYGLLLALVREAFSPDRPRLRLLPISDSRARRLAGTFRALFFFLLFTAAGITLLEHNRWYPALADGLRILQNAVAVLAGAAILSSSGFVKRLRTAEGSTWWAVTRRYLGRVVFPALVITLLFVVTAGGLGYVPLAKWFAGSAGWTLVRIYVALLAYRWLRRTMSQTIQFYRAEPNAGGESEAAALAEADTVGLGLERIGGGILRLIVIVLTVLWVLAGWHLPPDALLEALSAPLLGHEGTTWGQLLGGILKVVAVFAVGWFLRTTLTYFVFPRSKIGVGARYAILSILRYVVIAIAIVFALDAFGTDTSSLGWFFGAAGIGIGFGLQDVIGNFISGLIMLVERPISVGDTVMVGDTMGKVENIHMRGTILRTFDNTTILIPNNQMLGERVTNLSHSMRHIRIQIPVGVSYDADPEQVKDLLIDVARSNPRILDDPLPVVWFQQFASSSIDFLLTCYTSELGGRMGISSELRFEIFRRLGEAGIEIPFPQQDLHLKTGSLGALSEPPARRDDDPRKG